MKIKNESVSIKIGKKQYDFNNLILNEYLKRFVNCQLSTDNIVNAHNEKLNYILLKFEDKLEIDENSTIYNSDFDMFMYGLSNPKQTIYENQVILQYQYDLFGEHASLQFYDGSDISDHYGEKITAIGFNSWPTDSSTSSSLSFSSPVCAVLDVSNYDIYFQEGQDITVSRKDTISSDAEFYSKFSQLTGPTHLAPYGAPVNSGLNAYGILYSIGLSYDTNHMETEYVVGEDIEIQNEDAEITILGLEEYKKEDALYPALDLYPSENLYPDRNSYKYIILKYKIWQKVLNSEDEYEWSDTGFYYYQIYTIDKFGKMNFKIKYERVEINDKL